MLTTSNLGLLKPEGTDVVDIANFNANADKIDSAIGNMAGVPTTAKTAAGAISELFTSVSNGKQAVAAAITGKGQQSAATDTFTQMAAKITGITTGVETGDATALAINIVAGYTAYVKGSKVTGTMPNRGAVTITPSASAQPITEGYHSGSGTVAAVNVPAANLLTGTTIAGTAGTMPNNAGDKAALAIAVSGTTLKLRAAKGYTDGVDDNVTLTDANFISSNIKKGAIVHSLTGTYEGEPITGETMEVVEYGEDLAANDPVYVTYSDMPTKLANPSVLPAYAGTYVATSPSGAFIMHVNTKAVTIYKRVGDVLTNIVVPELSTGDTWGRPSFTFDNVYMAIPNKFNILIFKIVGDTFTLLTTLTPTSSDYIKEVKFSADGLWLNAILAYNVITIKKVGDTFTKIVNPDTTPAVGIGNLSAIAISPNSTRMVVAGGSSPYLAHFHRSGDIWIRSTVPSMGKANINDLEFSPDGLYLVIGSDTAASSITICSVTGGVTLTSLGYPAITPTGSVIGIAFSNDGKRLVAAHTNTPFVTIYNFEGGVATKIANPVTLPSSTGSSVCFCNLSKHLIVGTTSVAPYISIYKFAAQAYKSTGNSLWKTASRLGYVKETGTINQEKQVAITHT